jgi:hypothetical protein
MLELCRNKFSPVLGLALLLIIGLAFLLHASLMWENAVIYSSDASSSLGVFQQASNWISQNLQQGEKALVPSIQTFYVNNPNMAGQLISYSSVWNSANITLQANTTDSDITIVRNYLIMLLKENPSIKYVVIDWIDPYGNKIFDLKANDELMFLLKEVKIFPFTLSTGWSNKITIYSTVAFSNKFTLSFSSPPNDSFTSPENLSINYDSNGATIYTNDLAAGIYVQLASELTSFTQNYFTLTIRTNITQANLQVLFYYDKNKDGVFSGYDVDYVKSVDFSSTSCGWTNDTASKIFGVIPAEPDSIVQIGFIVIGNNTGQFNISNFQIFSGNE